MTNTDISWLAALISPRSVSPHPNFRSTDLVTPPGLLGLTVTGDHRPRGELVDRLSRGMNDAELTLIEAAGDSIRFDRSQQGGNQLAELAAGARELDPAMRAAAAVLAATALSEMDTPYRAVEVLDRAAALMSTESDDGRLLVGALMQQKAMRACEAGMPFEEARDFARELLSSVDLQRVSRYPTSKGARWPAATTNRNMLRALQDANQDLFDAGIGFPNTRTLKRLLKTSNSPLLAAMIQHSRTGETAYIKEAFSAFAMSNERSVRNQDPVDHPVWRSLMFFELLGHRRMTRRHRTVLGELRMLRSHGSVELTVEGLRLLRHAGESKQLKLALGLVRSAGPLAALAQEAEAIVTNRLAPALLQDVELATLEASAQVLSVSSADTALTCVLAALDEVPIVAPFRRELMSVQMENLFETAAALAPVANRVSDVATKVLESAIRIGRTGDELLFRAHSAGLRPLDWDDIDDAVKDRWRAWLAEHEADKGWGSLVSMLIPELRTSASAVDEIESPGMDRIASELNAVMANPERSETTKAWLRDEAARSIEELLEKGRQNAAAGSYAMHSYEPADLAVALIQNADAELWPALTEYLLEPRLPRRLKTSALNRISAAPETVPDAVKEAFELRGSSLFEVNEIPDPFESPDINPYPAAVRLFTALGLYSTNELVSALAILAAGDTVSKLEAARTLSTIVANISPTPEWAVSIALQLSSDENANVRAETGRTLAVALQNSDFAHDVVLARLIALLGEDGMLVPLLVLRGLATERGTAPGQVWDRVSHMADHHPVFGVRITARYLLDQKL